MFFTLTQVPIIKIKSQILCLFSRIPNVTSLAYEVLSNRQEERARGRGGARRRGDKAPAALRAQLVSCNKRPLQRK